MKSMMKNQAARTFVVQPSARRCGADDVVAKEEVNTIDLLVKQAQDTDTFVAVSDRVFAFANAVDLEIRNLSDAQTRQDAVALEKGAQRIATLASEVGASDLIRCCYQLLITVRQGDHTGAFKISEQVSDAYAKLKTTLRLA